MIGLYSARQNKLHKPYMEIISKQYIEYIAREAGSWKTMQVHCSALLSIDSHVWNFAGIINIH